MKLTLQKLSMLLLMLVVGMGSAWAEEVTISIGINPSESSASAYLSEEQEFTIDGVTFKMCNFNPSSGQIRGNQSSAFNNFYIYNTTPIPGTLKSVKIEGATLAGDKALINYGSNAFSAPSGTITGQESTDSEWTDLSGDYFCVSFNKGATSGTVKMTGITITYETGETVQKIATTVTYTGDATNEVVFGEEFVPARFVVDAADQTPLINAVLTYESSDPDVAEVDEAGNVTINGAGTAVITATYAGDDNYYGGRASYTLTVTDPNVQPVNSFEEAFATATTTAEDILFQFENVQVVGVNGNQVLIQDQDGHGAVIYQKNHGFVAGNELNGTVNCKYLLYGVGYLEFTGVSSSDLEVTDAKEVIATPHAIGDLELINYGSLVTIEGLTYAGNNVFNDATGESITMYNTFKISDFSDIVLEEGAEYTVTGAYVLYNETKEFAPRSIDDIVKTSADKEDVTIAVYDDDNQAELDDNISMIVGETINFSAYASSQAWVTITSEGGAADVAISEAHNGGTITAVEAGDATITFTTEEDDVHNAGERTITVTVSYGQPADMTETYIALDPSYDEAIDVVMGEEFNAPSAMLFNMDTDESIPGVGFNYESSDPDVAEVDDAGNVTINGVGTATITVSYSGDQVYMGSRASYTINVTEAALTSLFEAFQQKTSTATEVRFTFNNVVVTGVTTNNAYLEDGRGYGALIYAKNHGFNKGDVLSGTVTCNIQDWKGALEFTNLTSSTEGLEIGGLTAAPTPTETTVASLNAEHTGKYVTLAGLTYTGSDNVFTYAGADAEYSVTAYKTFITLPEFEEGAEYTITGIYIYYNGTEEIAPLSADDIVKNGDTPVEKQYPTYTVSGLESVTTNSEYVFTVETDASGLQVTLEPTDLAELTSGEADGTYILKTNSSEGSIMINISTEEDDNYYADFQTYDVTIVYGNPEPMLETACLSMSAEDTSYDVIWGSEFEYAPTAIDVCTVDGASIVDALSMVTYSSSNPDVAEVDETTGAVTINGIGEATITVYYPGNWQYSPSTFEYTINVTSGEQEEYNIVGWDLTAVSYSYSDENAVKWTSNDVTASLYKAYSNYAANAYIPAEGNNNATTRIYKDQELIIEPAEGVEVAYVKVTCESAAYAEQLAAFEFVNASATVSDNVVTVTPEDGATVLSIVNDDKVCRLTYVEVYYTGEAEPSDEKTDVTINVLGADGGPLADNVELTVGETLDFSVYASSQATVAFTGSNDEVATVERAVTHSGGVITAVAAGEMTITFTTEEDDYYNAGEKIITVTVKDEETPFEITDGEFDFAAGVDYGSGVEVTSDGSHYETEASIWTAGNVTLVADGKYRWWYNASNGNTLRFYSSSAVTFSVPKGYVITSIASRVSMSSFTPSVGEINDYEWTGMANTVTFTKESGSAVNFSTIIVTYAEVTSTYERDVVADTYGTICLDRAATREGAILIDVLGVTRNDAGKVTAVAIQEHTGLMEAGHSYVYLATSDKITATCVGDAVTESVFSNYLVGNLTAGPIEVPNGCYIFVDSKLRQVQGGLAYVTTNRAYMDLGNAPAFDETMSEVGVRYINVDFKDATAINSINAATADGAIYNLQGQKLDGLQRGINVVNGKKVLVK